MSKKFFCYVDETGQDTRGDLFIVAVVVIDEERDQFMQICEKIEQETGKGRTKWRKTAYKRRVAYMQNIVAQSIFQSSLNLSEARKNPRG